MSMPFIPLSFCHLYIFHFPCPVCNNFAFLEFATIQRLIYKLGIKPELFCINVTFSICLYLANRAELEKLTPEISRFTEVDQELVAGVIVTLKASKENGGVDDQGITYDFISRYFAPWVGIPEDPVTGKYYYHSI